MINQQVRNEYPFPFGIFYVRKDTESMIPEGLPCRIGSARFYRYTGAMIRSSQRNCWKTNGLRLPPASVKRKPQSALKVWMKDHPCNKQPPVLGGCLLSYISFLFIRFNWRMPFAFRNDPGHSFSNTFCEGESTAA